MEFDTFSLFTFGVQLIKGGASMTTSYHLLFVFAQVVRSMVIFTIYLVCLK